MRSAVVALLLLAACRKEGPSPGAKLYASLACATCHGETGAGGSLVLALAGKREHWTREKLVEYLKDPIGYAARDARLSAQARTYTLPMQRYDKAKPEELLAVADYVLSL